MSFQDTIEQIQNIDLSDIDRIGVWPFVVRAALWLALFALLFVGAYFVFIKDLNATLLSAENKETQLRETFQRKATEAANLEAFREQMRSMKETLDGLVSQLPSETEIPGLLDDISEKGETSGLSVNSIDIQNDVVSDFYIEKPVEIKVTGNYHDLGSFVSGIASMPRIVTLHDFTVNRSNGSQGLDMTILAKTYRYKEQE